MLTAEADNPFRVPGRWLKGALHVHTNASDGVLSPVELAHAYRKRGFDFMVLTDHDKVTGPVRLDGDFLVLPGIELGPKKAETGKCWHFIGLGVREAPPTGFDSAVAAYDYLRANVGFCFLAHPYWSQLAAADLTLFDGLSSVEVWNSGCELEVGRGQSEYQWDWCLSTGRRMTGIAVDDAHGRAEIGLGWVMVRAGRASTEDIIDALSGGRFYSSCGPEILDVSLSEEGIEVKTSPCRSISFICDQQTGARVCAEEGRELTMAAYAFKGRERYVRVQCVDGRGRRAWSNPWYLEWPSA